MTTVVLRSFCWVIALALPAAAGAAEWSWTWPAAPGDPSPQAQVTPFRYDKQWAYSVEIDDGPASTLAVAQPLLATQHYTDAPPGVSGGEPRPFVGGAAVMLIRVGGNSTFLDWPDLRTLQERGWGIINHSYAHAGRTWGNPPEILSAEAMRTDLFWSQALLAHRLGGRAPSHFVYPNGYTDYREHFAEFGLRSGSRVGGSGGRDPAAVSFNPLDLPRNYLDEGPWAKTNDPMHGIPGHDADGPPPGTLVIDFTHGINDDPASANHQRWVTRLTTLGERFGAAGRDNVWCAPTGEVLEYVAARDAATIHVEPGRLTVTLPDDVPGSALTIRLTGIPAATALNPPEGGILHRDGDHVWVTTPVIGEPGSPPPLPAIELAHEGAFADVTFDAPVHVAAVRVHQMGRVGPDATIEIDAIAPDGSATPLIAPDKQALSDGWGVWRLYAVVPGRPAVAATGLRVRGDASLKRLEVWATR